MYICEFLKAGVRLKYKTTRSNNLRSTVRYCALCCLNNTVTARKNEKIKQPHNNRGSFFIPTIPIMVNLYGDSSWRDASFDCRRSVCTVVFTLISNDCFFVQTLGAVTDSYRMHDHELSRIISQCQHTQQDVRDLRYEEVLQEVLSLFCIICNMSVIFSVRIGVYRHVNRLGKQLFV